MEKIFEKLFSVTADGETPTVARAQSIPAFKQLYPLLLAKQGGQGAARTKALTISFNLTASYLCYDLATYKKVIGVITTSLVPKAGQDGNGEELTHPELDAVTNAFGYI